MGPLPIDPMASITNTPAPQERAQRTPPEVASPSQPEERTPSALSTTRDALLEPIQRINEAMRPRGLEFDISEESSRIITRVIDSETGDVIRQIPAEEIIVMAERLEELQGNLISLNA